MEVGVKKQAKKVRFCLKVCKDQVAKLVVLKDFVLLAVIQMCLIMWCSLEIKWHCDDGRCKCVLSQMY